jgi:hypothetical protein
MSSRVYTLRGIIFLNFILRVYSLVDPEFDRFRVVPKYRKPYTVRYIVVATVEPV